MASSGGNTDLLNCHRNSESGRSARAQIKICAPPSERLFHVRNLLEHWVWLKYDRGLKVIVGKRLMIFQVFGVIGFALGFFLGRCRGWRPRSCLLAGLAGGIIGVLIVAMPLFYVLTHGRGAT